MTVERVRAQRILERAHGGKGYQATPEPTCQETGCQSTPLRERESRSSEAAGEKEAEKEESI